VAPEDPVFQGKLVGLASSLASALQDGSRGDSEILFTPVIGQLENPHVRLPAQFEVNPADTILATLTLGLTISQVLHITESN
jgi:hypothetical protein